MTRLKIYSIRLSSLFILLFCGPVLAEDAEVWETFGEWTIRINAEDTSRCYATRELPDGSVIEIGTEPTLDGGYFAIYNPQWTHIEDGTKGTVEFDFGRSRFGGDAVGRVRNGIPGGYVFFNNPDFVQEFARRQTVKVIGKNVAAFEIDLTGTSRATRTVLACQDAQPAPEDGN